MVDGYPFPASCPSFCCGSSPYDIKHAVCACVSPAQYAACQRVCPPGPPPPVIVGRYPFLGPFTHRKQLRRRAGILALLEYAPEGTLPSRPLFVIEAEDLQAAMAQLQARSVAGGAHGRGSIAYAALYTDLVAAARRQIVAELRKHYQLPDSWLMALSSASPPPAGQSARRRGA